MRILRLTGIETGAPIAIDGDKLTTLSEYVYGDFCGSIICLGTSCVKVRETPEQILAHIGGEGSSAPLLEIIKKEVSDALQPKAGASYMVMRLCAISEHIQRFEKASNP